MKTLRILVLLLGVFSISACAVPLVGSAISGYKIASYAKTGIDGVLWVTTDKTSTDHILSVVNEKDCTMFNIVNGEEICQDLFAKSDTPIEKVDLAFNELAPDIEEIQEVQIAEVTVANEIKPVINSSGEEVIVASADPVALLPRRPKLAHVNPEEEVSEDLVKRIGSFFASLLGKKKIF